MTPEVTNTQSAPTTTQLYFAEEAETVQNNSASAAWKTDGWHKLMANVKWKSAFGLAMISPFDL